MLRIATRATVGRRPVRRNAWAVVAPVVALVVGCATTAPSHDATPEPTTPSITNPGNLLTAEAGGTVSSDGVTVSVDAGQVDGDIRVDIAVSPAEGSAPLEGASPVGEPRNIQLQGGRLTGSARVSFEYDEGAALAVEPNLLFIATFDEAQGSWAPVESTTDVGTHAVSARVDHFSRYRLFGFPVDGLRAVATSSVADLTNQGLTRGDAPDDCPRDYRVQIGGSSPDALIAVCTLRDTGDALVTIHNRTAAAMQFAKPASGRLSSVSLGSLGEIAAEQLDTLNEFALHFDNIWVPAHGTATWRAPADQLPLSVELRLSNQGIVYDAMFAAIAASAPRLGLEPARVALDVMSCVTQVPQTELTVAAAIVRTVVRCLTEVVPGLLGRVLSSVLGGITDILIGTWDSMRNFTVTLAVEVLPDERAPSPTEPPASSPSPDATLPPGTPAPDCPPVHAVTSPFYIYAAMCHGEWAVVLEANCTSGHSSGYVFHAEGGRWASIGAAGQFGAWPPPAASLEGAGVPREVGAAFAAAPDRPSDLGCAPWVVPTALGGGATRPAHPRTIKGDGIHQRKSPTSTAVDAGPTLARGAVVQVVCQTAGEIIGASPGAANDGGSWVWDQLSNGAYVADLFVDTRKDVDENHETGSFLHWDSEIPICQ